MKHIQILVFGLLLCMSACHPLDRRRLALNKQMSSYEFVDDPHMQLLLDSGWISQEIHDMIYDYPLCEKNYKKAVEKAESILDTLSKYDTPAIKMPFSLPMPCTKKELFLFLKYDADVSDYKLAVDRSSYNKTHEWEKLLEIYKDIYIKGYESTFYIFNDTLIDFSMTMTGPVHDAIETLYGQYVMSDESHDKSVDYNNDTTTFDHFWYYWQNENLILSVHEDILRNSEIKGGGCWSHNYKGSNYESTIRYKYRPGYASYRKKYHALKIEDQIKRKRQAEEQRLKDEQARRDKLQKQHDDSVARVNKFLNSI